MKSTVIIGVFKSGTFMGDKKYTGLEIHSGKNDERYVFLPTFHGPIKIWWDDFEARWYGEVDLITKKSR